MEAKEDTGRDEQALHSLTVVCIREGITRIVVKDISLLFRAKLTILTEAEDASDDDCGKMGTESEAMAA